MEDSQIVSLYFDRSEEAIEETEKKYGGYCRYIARHIVGSDEDAEQILNDTWLKIWNTVPPNNPQSLKAYAGMICRGLSISQYNKNAHEKRETGVPLLLDELSECIPDRKSEDLPERAELSEALSLFIRSLGFKKQKIFILRYFYASSISEISKELDMKESSVKMALMRLRKKLREHLEKEGIDI